MRTTTLFPIPPAHGDGDRGLCVKFRVDSTSFPNGFTIQMVDEAPVALPKEIVISECPHSFVPAGNQASGRKLGTTGTRLYVRVAPSAAAYDCVLKPGQDYYINARHYVESGPRSMINCQFGVSPR